MAFYAVYITEAHPSDLWQLPSNVRDQVVFANPRTQDERENVAGSCVRKLGIQFPALIDGLNNQVETDYTGWPDRLYLVDKEGRVAFKSAPGPYGFNPADLRATLERTPI